MKQVSFCGNRGVTFRRVMSCRAMTGGILLRMRPSGISLKRVIGATSDCVFEGTSSTTVATAFNKLAKNVW